LTEIVLPHNWRPRLYQRKLWDYLESGGKRAIEIAHRRWGKDDLCLHWSACAAMQRGGSYWHLLPEYSQARKAIWTAVNPHTGLRRIDEAFPKEIRETTNETEMFVRLRNGSTWQVIGSDNYSSLVGTPPCGLTFSEWARANPASWGFLAPIVLENNGWAVFISTPLGRNHAHSMLEMAQRDPAWFAEISTVADTGAISLDAVEQQRREYHALFGEDAGDAMIQQEYWCSFSAAVLGAYWGREMATIEREGRICKLDIQPDYPIHVAWDLGVEDSTALWCFQVYGSSLHVVDYYESSGVGLDHYANWLDARGYRGTDWVPHDAKMREWGSPGARTRIEAMVQLGRQPRIVPNQKLMDGINAGRKTLAVAKFDGNRCAKGLECLRQYRAEWSEDLQTFRKTPQHDWASHGADAWRYLSVAWQPPAKPPEPKPTGPQWPKTDARGIWVCTPDDLVSLVGRSDRPRV
jgi:phage terminase large subunit